MKKHLIIITLVLPLFLFSQVNTDSLVFYLNFSSTLNDQINNISPTDSLGSLVVDRHGNDNSAYFSETDFNPLVYANNPDFDFHDTAEFSISMWFKAKQIGECYTDILLGKGDVQLFHLHRLEYGIAFPCGNTRITGGHDEGGLDSYGQAYDQGNTGVSSEFNNDAWNHLVLTFDKTKWRFYINSELKDSSALNENAFVRAGYDLTIGANFDSVYLDDIYIFKRKLTETDVTVLYNHQNVSTTQAQQPANWTDGSGGIIMNLAELRWLSETPDAWDEDWELGADIDAEETKYWNIVGEDTLGFSPIGYGSYLMWGNSTHIEFTGSIDGHGYEIKNLYINRTDSASVGLLGSVANATIKNVTVTNSRIKGGSYVGSIAGLASQVDFENCIASGFVNGYFNTGGVVGFGFLNNKVLNCHFVGDVNGEINTGGFVGNSHESEYSKCSSQGTVTSAGHVGGFFGQDSACVSYQCFSSSSINLTSSSLHKSSAGGFTGRQSESHGMYNCFATGSVQSASNAGALIGYYDSHGYTFKSCYATGRVESDLLVEGFIGESDSPNEGEMENCYFDSLTIGTARFVSKLDWGNSIEDTAYAISTAEFGIQSTFFNWNFDTIWAIALLPEFDSVPRPYLQWMIADTNAITLSAGWNLLSFNKINADSSVSNVFVDIIDKIEVIKTMDNFYYPENEDYFNNLDFIEIGKGYLVKVREAVLLSQDGDEVPSSTYTMRLKAGWNLIGSPYSESIPIESAFATVFDNVEIIKSFDEFYESGNELSSLLYFEPNTGYFIYVNTDCLIEWQ